MKKFLVLATIFILLLSGCSNMTEEEKAEYERQRQEEIANQPRYEYEDVEAEIIELDMRHWFATTHRYEWSISVYYEPYNLTFEDNGWSTGAFNAPSFYGKQVGDMVTVEICNTYIKDELVESEIRRIY